MKRIKIMLMSALVVAAVGGALAFKAETYSLGFKCGTTTNSCSAAPPVAKVTTVGADENNHIAGSFCTNDGSSNCTYVIAE